MTMLLVQSVQQSVVARRASLLDRLLVRVWRQSVDVALAGGASPEGSVSLALRSTQLVRMREREDLAYQFDRLADQARTLKSPRGRSAAIAPVGIEFAERELRDLADHLLVHGPVAARGVALARLLLTDGNGPLYRPLGNDSLRSAVLTAATALEPLNEW